MIVGGNGSRKSRILIALLGIVKVRDGVIEMERVDIDRIDGAI